MWYTLKTDSILVILKSIFIIITIIITKMKNSPSYHDHPLHPLTQMSNSFVLFPNFYLPSKDKDLPLLKNEHGIDNDTSFKIY